MMFDADFFRNHQRPLLDVLNSRLGGVVRRSLWIPDRRHRVVKLTPNAAHVLLPDGQYRAILYSNSQYGQALRRNYKPLWEALHWWDMRWANRFMPAWNAGFDTYSSQPDETSGVDTYIDGNNPTTNSGTDTKISIGELDSISAVHRTMIKFDLSSIPAGAYTSSNILSLWILQDNSSNARNCKAFRILRDWVEAQATWNIWSTANNWTTAGCGSDGNDADLTTIWATTAYTATESVGAEKQFSLLTSEFDKFLNGTYTNYGWLLKMDTETNDNYYHDSSSSVTSGERPKLAVTYQLGGGEFFHLF